MPTRLSVGMLPGNRERQQAKQLVVTPRQLAAAGDEWIEPIHLTVAKRSLEVGHSIVEAQVKLFVIPRAVRIFLHGLRVACNAMRAQPKQLFVKVRAIGHNHAALSRRDDFDRVETEDS